MRLTTLPADQLRQLRGSRMAMIFQEPMSALNPVMRVGDQIAEAVLAHNNIAKAEAWRQAVESMRDVAIPEPGATRPQLSPSTLGRHAATRHDRNGHRQPSAIAHC